MGTYEDLEVHYPKLRMEEEGAHVVYVSVHPPGTKVTGKYGYPALVNEEIRTLVRVQGYDAYHAILCPGGFAPDYYRRSASMREFVNWHFQQGAIIAAICHGPWMLCSTRKPSPTATGNGNGNDATVPLIKGLRCTAFHAIRDDLENAGGIFVDEPVVVHDNVITS